MNPTTPDNQKRNYRIYTIANVVTALAGGIFGPFYIVFINKITPNYQVFSIALGLATLFQAISAYLAGSYSDSIGRKPFLVLQGYCLAVVTLLYLLIQQPWQLYILSVIEGFLLGVSVTVGSALLADITNNNERGKHIGRRDALVNICAALTMMGGGLFATYFGIRSVFILMACAQALSATLLLIMRE